MFYEIPKNRPTIIAVCRQECQSPSSLSCLTLDRPIVHRSICIGDLEFDALGFLWIYRFQCEINGFTVKNPEQLVSSPQKFVAVSELIRGAAVCRHTLILRGSSADRELPVIRTRALLPPT